MKASIKNIQIDNPLYPPLLKEIPGPPRELFFRGVLPQENNALIAIVGTRKATSAGKLLAKQTAYELAEKNITIVSGLALGIDASAHDGALSRGGRTIAVLANGLDSVYPHQHEHLAEKIIEQGGCLISEYPQGTPSFPSQFLERNRIISGLCIATIVIEAPIRSGSIATARNAIEQGREVFVFPGLPSQQNYKGSHMLIRSGARLVTSVEDILEDLGEAIQTAKSDIRESETISKKETNIKTDNEAEMIIIKTLKDNKKALSVDNLIELTTLEPHVVHQSLAMLLINGVVEEKNSFYTIIKRE